MKTTPRDFFLNLGIMVALIWVATSTIVVLFDLINIFVPDVLARPNYYGGVAQVSTFAIASLIIILPILVVFSRLVLKDMAHSPEKSQFAFRRWMMYVTLFLASVTIVADLVVSVNMLLSGGVTLRFVLQAVAILLVSGGVFWYVAYQLKRDFTKPGKDKIIAWSVIGAIILMIVVSIIVSGTPQKQRQAISDIERLNGLMHFEQVILAYYQNNDALPEDGSAFSDALGYPTGPVDPITNEPYKYEKTSALSFRICANFDGTFDDIPENWTTYGMARQVVKNNWDFSKGQSCFDRTIDPNKLVNPNKLDPASFI